MSGKNSASAINSDIRIYPDPASLARAAAENFVSLAAVATARHDLFSVALSGGSTPRLMHTYLALPSLSDQVAWERVHVFWGDERCVPAEHADSNYRMAYETLLEHVPIPSANIHPIQGETLPSQAAEEYEAELRGFFENGDSKTFDLVFLGLGEDGHTASLFPGSGGLQERKHWVIPVEHSTPPAPLVDRVSLTPALINTAAQVIFLVAGEAKAGRVAQVLKGPYQPETLPAQSIQPVNGALVWMLDAAAASRLV